MDAKFSAMYEADIKGGRPSIAPEKLMRAMLLQVLYSVRSAVGPTMAARLRTGAAGRAATTRTSPRATPNGRGCTARAMRRRWKDHPARGLSRRRRKCWTWTEAASALAPPAPTRPSVCLFSSRCLRSQDAAKTCPINASCQRDGTLARMFHQSPTG
jgi:hypothetical protein